MRVFIVVIALALGAFLLPATASEPASQDGNVPTTPGETLELTWTGQTLPGAEQSGQCQEATSDVHEVTFDVADGTYEDVIVAGRVDITYDGPATDIIVTLLDPEGTATTGDSGFTDTDESVGFGNPVSGTYKVLVCAFAGVIPQAYDGTMTLEAQERVPSVDLSQPCPAPDSTLKFEMDYIDTTRAGGEPIVETLDDGTLLWGSHAGTTHFFGPAAPDEQTASFIQNYEGQTYQYYSEDDGATWQFAPRTPVEGGNAPGQGFSDPVFTVDQAGNVFISEINLANVAVSKSTDNGRTYTLQNLLAFVNSDRQWMAADEEDVVYMTANAVGSGGAFPLPPTFSGHFIAKSVDGGASFVAAEQPNPDGIGDIQVDFDDGTLYELQVTSDGTISMGAFRNIRNQMSGFDEGFELGEITTGGGFSPINRLIDPTFDMDAEGNLYTVWSENGTGAAGRPPGIYYSYSTDRGATWHQPAIRVDRDARTDIWPWIAVGAPGQVAINYLQVDAELENNNAELATDEQGWNVITAHTQFGQGCGLSDKPGFQHTTATSEPIHFGTICQGGTLCQTQAVDRRLGDYFANEIDGNGNVYVSVSDTRMGGAVSLPLVIRQVEGTSFNEQVPLPETPDPECGAGSADDPSVTRVNQSAAVALGIGLAQACAESADTALLARDDVFADALAGAGLAAARSAPLFLNPTGGLSEAVADELTRLGVQTVVLLGGPAALDEQVATDLAAMDIQVQRLGGEERFSTARLVAEAYTEQAERAIVALGVRNEGDPWPDALAAGVLSAADGSPVLLSAQESVPEVTLEALRQIVGEGGAVTVAGGPAAVRPPAVDQLEEAGFQVTRAEGSDRYGTAAALVRQAIAAGAQTDVLVIASGEGFEGPLVAGPAADVAGGIMVLVQPDSLDNGDGVRILIEELAPDVTTVVIVGNQSVISARVEEQIRDLITSSTSTPTPTPTPTDLGS